MLNKLKALFVSTETQTPEADAALAGAALMFEVAWADHDVSEAELQCMASLLQELFDLEPNQVKALVQKTHELNDESVGVFAFTRAVNEALDAEEKFQIVCALWQLAMVDKTLNRFEEHTIRRIAELLYVPHAKFIEAKLRAKRSR